MLPDLLQIQVETGTITNISQPEDLVFLDITSDFHMHTSFSDGSSSVEEMCLAALQRGMRRIAITDHMPLPFATRYAIKHLELARYREVVLAAKRAFQGQLAVEMGLEIEYIAAHSGWIEEITALGWDYLIVSIHHLPGKKRLHLVNGHEEEFAKLSADFAGDTEGLCRSYYRTLQEAIATGLFTCVGHLDVLKKWNKKHGHIDESSPWYQSLVCETLDRMVQHGTMMEINTGGLTHELREQYPSDWIIHQAIQRSIPIVLGSDSHSPQNIGQHFTAAEKLAHRK